MSANRLRYMPATLLTACVLFAGWTASAQPVANLDHDIVDENNEPFDMNGLIVDGPLVLLVSSGT